MAAIDIISLNTRGLGDGSKRRELFHYIHLKQFPVVLLQETHSTHAQEAIWRSQWGKSIWFSHGTSKSTGVAILIGGNFYYEVHDVINDEEGRSLIMDVTLGEQRITLVNLYGPNKDDTSFFTNLMDLVENLPNDNRIFGGDFNVILDLEIDRKGGSKLTNFKSQEIIQQWLSEKDLVDIWRVQNPDRKMYTWSRKKPIKIFSRLDYFLVSFGLQGYINKTDILPGFKSDHSAIKISLVISSNKRGPGFWKLNCSLLENEKYIKRIKDTIKETIEFNTSADPTLLWETIKCKVRGDTISYAANIRREANEKIRKIEKSLNFELSRESGDNEEKITQLKAELNREIEIKTKGAIFRSKIRYFEEGEKSTKYFLNLEKRNYNKKVINKLKVGESIITDPTEILAEEARFYSNLYTSKIKQEINHSVENRFFSLESNIPKLSEENSLLCEGLIKAEELNEVIHTFARNKTPGSDGLPLEFYLAFWDDVRPLLLASFNNSYQMGTLGITQRQGVLSLIPKKDRDIQFLKNWRPISLLNFDYKLLTKCLTKRIERVIESIIHRDQSGFIKGRYIGENVNKIFNLATYLKNINNKESYIMAVDFEKAFDFLEFSYIDKVMKYLNFGPMLCHWLNTIYSNTSSCVVNNGWASNFFKTSRGVRQGCPLSPYLFIIAVELLAHNIRQNKEIEGITIDDAHYKIALYADDTTLMIGGGEKSVQAALATFKDFYSISGLKINVDKTHIMPVGDHEYQKTKICHLGLSWTTGPLTVLGIKIDNTFSNFFDLNYLPKIDIIKKQLSIWSNRNMTPMGRVIIVKTYIISQLTYLFLNLPSPTPEYFLQIDKLIFNFIWNGKVDKIKRGYMRLNKDEGGLNVPHLRTQDKVLKISWLHRVLNIPFDDHLFKQINNMFYGRLKYILTCNLSQEDCHIFLKQISPFWVDVIKWWCSFNFAYPKSLKDILSQSLWYNSHIQINEKVLFHQCWYTNGIKYVYNLVKWTGTRFHFMSLEELNNKFNCNIKTFQYSSLLDSLPREWRRVLSVEIKHDIVNTDFQHTIEKIVILKKPNTLLYNKLKISVIEEPIDVLYKWQCDGFEITLDRFYYAFQMIYTSLISVKLRMFQFKLLHRRLALNPFLHRIGIKDDAFCSSCGQEIETEIHFFCTCSKAELLWASIIKYLDINISVSNYDKIFCNSNNSSLNKILVIVKHYMYTARCKGETFLFSRFLNYLKDVYQVEKTIALSRGKLNVHRIMWSCISTTVLE